MNGIANKSTCFNRGAWTADEDRILTEYVERHGPKRWNSVAIHSGLNRCGKSCRLRWMNYLRPDIKRGNISDAEDDLIIRLHSLLGNRWSLIAGRLPGRTDNEIKNYWNAHLWKKASNKALMEKSLPTAQMQNKWNEGSSSTLGETNAISCGDGLDLEWVKSFLELDDDL